MKPIRRDSRFRLELFVTQSQPGGPLSRMSSAAVSCSTVAELEQLASDVGASSDREEVYEAAAVEVYNTALADILMTGARASVISVRGGHTAGGTCSVRSNTA